ncbi:Pre-mRNA-splicing factor cwc26 [Paecilomyces lecythidis]|uniref:Pre-mRNA-splicing factor cwc26 n=1 Tax=Paecilomyces lecythidis TaxID=3004212 RepID=A0ABR3Y125_9EURO
MPSSSLADYLAKNYLTADPVPERPKKKRKKTKQQPSDADEGLIIADDDPPDLRTATTTTGQEDEDSPYVVNANSAEFRRAKKSSWKTVGGPTSSSSDQAAADAILASAAAESAARRDANEDEDAPAIADAEEDHGPRMESGARAGLQTAEQTAAMMKALEKRKKAESDAYLKQAGKDAAGLQETIYRDASGRIINVAMKRAEARRAEEEKKAKEEAAKETLLGDVQRREREARKEQIREARAMPLARTINDEDLNEELRARDRWNDPAAQFLTSKKEGVSVSGKPLYKGAFQPNRYGIRPGHRWDGVDRSNGFEKEWFAARNRKQRIGELEYQWQMDE